MRNSDVFTSSGYDMVVAVTQKSINDQIKHLANPDIGVIKTSFILGKVYDKQTKKTTPKFFQSYADVPKDGDGNPSIQLINGTYLPRISIEHSGTNIVLILRFSGGTAWFRNPDSLELESWNMENWQYGIGISLDFAQIARSDIAAGKPVPQIIIDRLTHFLSSGFSVAQMFIDFQSTDLVNFDPINTSVNQATDEARQAFVYMMTSYLQFFKDDPTTNPYILGYTVTQQEKDPDADIKVPPSLKPIGQTFTLYQDPRNEDLNTVNFILNTEAGQNPNLGIGSHSTPGIFDTNWIDSSEQCNGKMIYSSYACVETLFLIPFYRAYSEKMREKLTDAKVSIPSPPGYNSAKSRTGNGLRFDVANVEQGDDQYVNNYDISIRNSKGSVTIHFEGYFRVRKTARKDLPLCEGVGWAWGYAHWEADIVITQSKDSSGNPTLKVSEPYLNVKDSDSGKGQNTCADVWKTIADILGTILDVLKAIFTLKFDGFFTKLFNELVSPSSGDLPSPRLTLENLITNINGAFILPAGQVFFFKDPQVDPDGNLSVQLTYKSDTYDLEGSAGDLIRGPIRDSEGIQFIDGTHSRKIAVPGIDAALSGIRALRQPGEAVAEVEPPQSRSSPELSTPPRPAAPSPSPLAAPMFDKIRVSPIKPQYSDGLSATVSCELMTNMQRAMPVSPSKTFKVVRDSAGNPLIFAVGSDNGLKLLQSTSGYHPDGWSSTDLLTGFNDYDHAIDFDVSQGMDGSLSLSLMLAKKKSSKTSVFVASRLSNDLSKTNFSKLPSLCTEIDGIDDAFIGRNIMLGSSDDTKRPLVVAIGDINSTRYFYQIKDSENTAAKLEFPENLDIENNGLLGMAMGFIFGQRANYFLYDIGDTKSLVAITLADDSLGSLFYDYSPGEHLPEAYRYLSYNTITTLTARTGSDSPSSDIYIGAATGVYRIPNGKTSLMEQVTDEIKDVHEIRAASHGTDDISLWVTASPSNLYYIRGIREAESRTIKWNAPVLFQQNALFVAPIRTVKPSSAGQSTNEIFTIDSELTITHYWQDPSSTIWHQRTARVQESDYVLNFKSYTTHLHLESASGSPVHDKVKITSSEWQYVTINGSVYSLDADVPAEVEADMFGDITIISPATDISPAVIHVTSDAFREVLNIYPHGKVHHHLSSVSSGASLSNARTQDNKPLLEGGIKDDVAEGVAHSLSKLHGSAAGEFQPSKSGNTFTAVELPDSPANAKAVKHSLHSAITFDHLPEDFSFGMASKEGSWTVLEGYHVQTLKEQAALRASSSSVTDIFGDIWHFLEDVFHGVIKVIEDGVIKLADGISFLISKVDEGLQFLLNIGDKVIQFALDTLVKVYKAINFVLKLVGIDLDKVLSWIGHLLGWDHVWATHKLIAGMCKNFVDYGIDDLSSLIETARGTVKTVFTEVGDQVKNLVLPDDMKGRTIDSLKGQVDAKSRDNVAKAPASNFASYHMIHTGPADKDDEIKDDNTSTRANDPIVELYNDVLAPVCKVLEQKLSQTGTDLATLLARGTLADIQKVCADVADIFLSALAKFIDGVLVFVQHEVEAVKSALEQPIHPPIFGALFDFVCGLMGEKEDMTVINVAALIAAIPAVTLCKISTGSTPDQWGQGVEDPNLPWVLHECVGTLSEGSLKSSAPPAQMWSESSGQPVAAVAPTGSSSGDSFKCPKQLRNLSYFQGLAAPPCSILSSLAGLYAPAPAGVRPMSSRTLTIICDKMRYMKALLTCPIPADGQHLTPYTFRWLSWLASGIFSVILDFLPEAAQNSVGLLVDLFGLSVAVGVDWVENADWVTWLTDVVASLGGAVTKGAMLAKQLEVAFGSLVVCHLVGDLGLYAKTGIDIANDNVFRTINIGGSGS